MLEHCINIREFLEASLQGKDWTEAFVKAVELLEKQGGGTIFVPAGIYSTRSIELKSNMTLYLDSDAVIDFMDDYENYQIVDTEFEGYAGRMYKPLVFADHATDVAIAGTGCLNGNGLRAWKEFKSLPYKRPYLICFQYCSNVKIENITLINSPVWTIHPLYCDNVMIRGVIIKNPPDSPNTDGINPNSCHNVHISDCFIDVGDDCIAIKAGTEHTPKRRSCENITITNCNMIHGHGGIVIGSEMSGSIRNITVSNCIFQDTDRGIRIKTRRRRGGKVEQLSFSNIIMEKVLCPFVFNMYYYCGTSEEDRYVWEKKPYPVDDTTPVICNIHISNIIASQVSAAAGFIYGLAEQYVEDITFSNCSVSMDLDGSEGMPAMLAHMEPMKAAGFYLRNAKNIRFDNVKMYNVEGNVINKDETVGLIIID